MRALSLSSLALSALAIAGCESSSPTRITPLPAVPQPSDSPAAAPGPTVEPLPTPAPSEPTPSATTPDGACGDAPNEPCLDAPDADPDAGASGSSGAVPCRKPSCAHGEEQVRAGTAGARTVRSCGVVIYCKKVWDCPPCGRG